MTTNLAKTGQQPRTTDVTLGSLKLQCNWHIVIILLLFCDVDCGPRRDKVKLNWHGKTPITATALYLLCFC